MAFSAWVSVTTPTVAAPCPTVFHGQTPAFDSNTRQVNNKVITAEKGHALQGHPLTIGYEDGNDYKGLNERTATANTLVSKFD